MTDSKARVTFVPNNTTVSVGKGMTILQAASFGGIQISSLCGGKHKCGRCKVLVRGVGDYVQEEEKESLSDEEIEQGYRLACVFHIENDTTVVIPEASQERGVAILEEGVCLGGRHVESDVTKVHLSVERATLDNATSDLDRVEESLRKKGLASPQWNPNLIRDLPELLRSSNHSITATLIGNELISIEEGDTTQDAFGMAVDIGTTTVVGYLLCLNTGEQVGVASRVNPQRTYGSDVVSRAGAASERPELVKVLQGLAVETINDIILELVSRSCVNPGRIYKMAVVGNTCMQHLFLGVTPKYLTLAPYTPVFTRSVKIPARELRVEMNPDGHIELLPGLAGFVGADTMGVILSTGIIESDAIKLAVDLGTNGEIVLGSKKGMLACSAAAGPAFEGEHIRCGMIAAPGAIDRVVIRDDVYVHTIRGAPSRGICGSGLIDAMAEMRKAGIIDHRGRLMNSGGAGAAIAESLQNRLRTGEEGNEFLLCSGDPKTGAAPVVVTQHDVEEFQLAKAAISAGVQILMSEMGVDCDNISEVFIAGAFGSYIRKESFCSLGILPGIDVERVMAVGNAAGEGAKMALLSTEVSGALRGIAEKTRYIELSAHPSFRQKFVHSMFFSEDS
jgi:uncharacterized 2Fe-2S/4Fe-4S cluster protein (DUF4445 family)